MLKGAQALPSSIDAILLEGAITRVNDNDGAPLLAEVLGYLTG